MGQYTEEKIKEAAVKFFLELNGNGKLSKDDYVFMGKLSTIFNELNKENK